MNVRSNTTVEGWPSVTKSRAINPYDNKSADRVPEPLAYEHTSGNSVKPHGQLTVNTKYITNKKEQGERLQLLGAGVTEEEGMVAPSPNGCDSEAD